MHCIARKPFTVDVVVVKYVAIEGVVVPHLEDVWVLKVADSIERPRNEQY